MAQPPISLTIFRQGDTNIVDLAESGSLIPRSETRVDTAFLQELSAEFSRVALPGTGVQELQRLGSVLFSHLLPASIRQRLRAAAPCDLYLRLDEALLQVPWELSYDGEQFLTSKFRVGRQVITSAPLPSTHMVPREPGPLRVLFIADPTETLPQASQEVEQLCALLGGMAGVKVTLLGGRMVRRVPLLAALQAHEVVHFAGHSVYQAQHPNRSGWVLHEGMLTAGELGKLSRPPLLVFSNSCQASATVAWREGSRYEEQAFGIGSAFLLAGVSNYLGSFCVVHDEESAVFATAFYQGVASGLSLGEALLHARQVVRGQSGGLGLTWASYLLYGDPAFKLLPAPPARSLPMASAITPPRSVGVLQRKLAAILSADVQGYSRLMGEDEETTIHTLTAYREVMNTLIQQHRGRVVDSPGDNLLAEFASAVDAVRCAVEIQQALKIRNAELPANRWMEFRIGINVGDVIVEGERLYGDGVNIAARLEGLAEGGGICLSGTVYDQVETKLDLQYEYLGERVVKNIAKPVRVYRVLASLTTAPPVVSRQEGARGWRLEAGRLPAQVSSLKSQVSNLVGRETELAQLNQWFDKALQGERQIIFVTGEPGIGKTTLVDAFLHVIDEARGWRLETSPSSPQASSLKAQASSLWLGQGQCIEHYGAGEAYLPVLTALGQLCREPGSQRLIELLGQHAPTWLVQMPALLSAADLDMLQRKTQGATKERMLRELAEAIEVLTMEKPLVLWLEDLHWSDYSTLDLLAVLARRRQPARLLVVGTSRPVEGQEHPLQMVKQELQLHGQCEEVALRFLTESDVAAYLTERFAAHQLPAALARTIHHRTEGNPLFMVNVVESLVAQESIVHREGKWELQKRVEEIEVRVPQSLRQLIETQLARLTAEEQRMLEVASVVGAEFSAAAVAAGLAAEVGEVEECCEGLARREQLLRARGTEEWPDGTVAARYGFIHALYQEVVYERVTAGRRSQLHQRIGEREEQAYGRRGREIAAVLAMHFEQGRDYRRAVQYQQQAGENAIGRSAHKEAITHLTKGLELLQLLPDTPERTHRELRLQIALGTALMATKGYAAPDAAHAYTRARELCRHVGDTPQLFPVLGGLWAYYVERVELQTASELATQMLGLAQSTQNSILLLWSHLALGTTERFQGQLLSAREHLEQSLALYTSQPHRSYGWVSHPGVDCRGLLADVLHILGYPHQARRHCDEALTLARELAHPFSLALALAGAATVHRLAGEVHTAQALEEEGIALCREQGFVRLLAYATIMKGWHLVEQEQREEGFIQMRQGLAALRATGAEVVLRVWYFTPLAEVYGKMGQVEDGLTLLTRALHTVRKTGLRLGEAELWRLRGELLLQSGVHSPQSSIQTEVEEYFQKAISIARQQHAKWWELRAVMSLSRLWQSQGKREEARQMLVEIYNWFTEGFATEDLKEAKALLETLEDRAVAKRAGKGDSTRGKVVKRTKKGPKLQQSVAERLEATTPAPDTHSEHGSPLALPDKPSIAVLPFVNLSGDPEQEYFSDGLTEDLITDLSRFSGLFVIARNSSFTYKGKTVKVQEVGKELGVRYVLEGSVRKAGDRVRITAQLVDAPTGHHLWAERYDRELHDIFALQDEIIREIISNLGAEVRQAELERVRRTPTANLTAYDYFLRGSESFWHFTHEMNGQARQLWEKAIALDPQYAEAYAWLGWTYFVEWGFFWSQDPQTVERAFELAQKALALDDFFALAHWLLGGVYLLKKQYDQAVAEGERAITLNPNDAQSYFTLATTLNLVGKPKEALGLAEEAMRRDPRSREWHLWNVSLAYFLMGRIEEASTVLKRFLTRYPTHLSARLLMAVLYSASGREAEALAEAGEVLRLSPHFSLEWLRQMVPAKDPAGVEFALALLRKAGLK